ncbi:MULTISPECIES: type II toxin-antitoxin system RelE/ParE family toxin [Mesonia]|uniref:Uncharacterized protein n=1 Tax=Mesonia oceanica TaxID=2687242 RepID=A0AC61Y923_9FLAO|nr:MULTISPECIES: type II toxin-antitoxin system RelE/ParE family toxin [Mesonia]MAN25854.1 plasmid stabilization system [Mesonia sp.]MAN27526.1 plasmid stabilization system [Mesonia sp.]MAQ40608.1 plasmid stabilization system [Mesonia sp.]VVV01009.1 hypothetical protein FVB9532_02287 [Mesonia oceanica]|tara:strand:- start:35992 stop:36291 length:300 start_codon:yes stop_codon:yes gene_type:complete
MASKQIIWTNNAKTEFYQILEFYIERNQSPIYSQKLLLEVEDLISTLENNEFIGRLTSDKSVRVFPIKHFLLFYSIQNEIIYILSFWDNRQDENKKLKL